MSRRLDAAVSEALGYEVKPLGENNFTYYEEKMHAHRFIPRYSTNGEAMLNLDREMRKRGYRLQVKRWNDGVVEVLYFKETFSFEDGTSGLWVDTDEPLTRALAAYKALTGKEWTE